MLVKMGGKGVLYVWSCSEDRNFKKKYEKNITGKWYLGDYEKQ